MVITLIVKLESVWSAEIELLDDSPLELLHLAIQDAVDFDNDHLYEFFVARTHKARDKVRYDDENGGVYDKQIRDLFPLPAKKRLFYLFDYGDSWYFTVTRSRKKQHESVDGVEYPRTVKETGERPEQYETWDEDNDEDWEEAA